jgi:hypothetical protein
MAGRNVLPQLDKPASRPKPNKPEVRKSEAGFASHLDLQQEQQGTPNDTSAQ